MSDLAIDLLEIQGYTAHDEIGLDLSSFIYIYDQIPKRLNKH